MLSRCINVQCMWSTANQRSSSEFQGPEFSLELHYIGMLDWLMDHHVGELSLNDAAWSEPLTLCHMVVTKSHASPVTRPYPKVVRYGQPYPKALCGQLLPDTNTPLWQSVPQKLRAKARLSLCINSYPVMLNSKRDERSSHPLERRSR